MTAQKTMLAFIACLLLIVSCKQYDKNSKAEIQAATASAIDEATQVDSARTIIRTAEIELQVDDVPQKINEIQSTVTHFNGRVTHYDINSNQTFQQEVACSTDSSTVIRQLSPVGHMKVKVPAEYSDTFVHALLSLDADIDKLLMDEEDVTEDLLEKKELVNSYASNASKTTALKGQMYDDEKHEQMISRKSDYAKLHYKSNYLWFDIHLKGKPSIESHRIVSAKNIHEPFYVNAYKAFNSGWYVFSMFLVVLLNLWPFIILAVLLLVAIKKKWFRKIAGFHHT